MTHEHNGGDILKRTIDKAEALPIGKTGLAGQAKVLFPDKPARFKDRPETETESRELLPPTFEDDFCRLFQERGFRATKRNKIRQLALERPPEGEPWPRIDRKVDMAIDAFLALLIADGQIIEVHGDYKALSRFFTVRGITPQLRPEPVVSETSEESKPVKQEQPAEDDPPIKARKQSKEEIDRLIGEGLGGIRGANKPGRKARGRHRNWNDERNTNRAWLEP